jgi:hypothetical protein
MTVYVCDSTVCPLRDKCRVKSWVPGDEVHIRHFRPQEEFSGECPHFMATESEFKNLERRPY